MAASAFIMLGLVALAFTLVGWVAFLVVGSVAAGASFYVDEHYLNPLINEYL